MTPVEKFSALFQQLPLVAILRGLTPEEAPAVGDALVGAGFGILEVPLNSPRPLESIGLLAHQCVGVLAGQQADALQRAG